MRCGLENGTEPIDYIWEHENKEGIVSILAQSNNSVLDVAYVTRNRTGWYRCLARNEVNQVLSERFWLDVYCKYQLQFIVLTIILSFLSLSFFLNVVYFYALPSFLLHSWSRFASN